MGFAVLGAAIGMLAKDFYRYQTHMRVGVGFNGQRGGPLVARPLWRSLTHPTWRTDDEY
jgi:hypothetical protein